MFNRYHLPPLIGLITFVRYIHFTVHATIYHSFQFSWLQSLRYISLIWVVKSSKYKVIIILKACSLSLIYAKFGWFQGDVCLVFTVKSAGIFESSERGTIEQTWWSPRSGLQRMCFLLVTVENSSPQKTVGDCWPTISVSYVRVPVQVLVSLYFIIYTIVNVSTVLTFAG